MRGERGVARVHLPIIPSVPNQFVMHRGPGDAKEADGAVLGVHFLALFAQWGSPFLRASVRSFLFNELA